jgi:WD40 repeat protein
MSPGPASFYTTGGTLSQDAPSYVERQADHDLFDGLRAGEFCYVLTSRQMGKSSLMVRTATKLREGGTRVIVLDLTAVGQNVTPEQWYDGLLAQIGRQLRLEDPLETVWRSNERLGPCQRFFAAIRDVTLPEMPAALVIFVDEIDTVRSLPFSTDEFFAAIRECYNRRGQDSGFRRLTFCLLGVATPSDLIRDTRTTPFNIGRRIELHDFTEEEAAPLGTGMRHASARETPQMPASNAGSPNAGTREAKRLLNRILFWTGGHPYLTQRFCRAIAEEGQVRGLAGVDRLGQELFFTHRAKERDDNLLFVRDRLLRSDADVPSLLELYLKVRQGEAVADDETSQQVSVLRLSGIVKSARGRLVARNRIYSRVFDRAWVHAHMPEAEVRRQRAAFNRGVLRTAIIAAVVVTALAIAVVIALEQLAISYFSQAQLRRGSGLAGQRLDSLEFLRLARRGFINDDELRDEAIACLALSDLEQVFWRSNFPPGAVTVALTPNLSHYAVANDQGAIEMIRISDGQIENRIPAIGMPVSWLTLSPGALYVAAGYHRDDQDRFVVWASSSRQAVFDSTNRVRVSAVDFSADNSKMVVCLGEGSTSVLELPGGARLASLPAVEEVEETQRARDVASVRFDWAGQQIGNSALGSLRAQIQNWKDQTTSYAFRPDDITALAWSPDGRHIAMAYNPGAITIWDLNLNRPRSLPLVHSEAARDLAFSPDGTMLASLGGDRTLNVWCQGTGRHVTLALDAQPEGRIFFAPDSERLGLADQSTGIRIWRVHGNREYRVVRAPTEVNAALTDVLFDPEGRVLVGANQLGVFLWDAATGGLLDSLTRQPSDTRFSVQSATVHPTKGDLFVSTPDGLLHLSRHVISLPDSGRGYRFMPTDVPTRRGRLKNCRLQSDGTRGIAVYEDGIYQFQTDSSLPSERLPIPGDCAAWALSRRGQWLAGWSEGKKQIQVWDLNYPDASGTPAAIFGAGRHFAFTSDERHILASSDRGHGFWDARTGKPLARLDLHATLEVGGPVAIGRPTEQSPDYLAVADKPGSVSLFELRSQTNAPPLTRLLARLRSPDPERATALAFNPQCSRLAVVSGQTAGIWDLALLRHELAALGLAGNIPVFAVSSNASVTVQIGQKVSQRDLSGLPTKKMPQTLP